MNTYHYAPFSKMFSPLKVFYKITPNVEGKPIQITHKKIHVPRSYREYVRTFNNKRHSFHDDKPHAEANDDDQDEEQDWGFFVDIDHVAKVVQRQKTQPPIKIKYSYYKYVQRFTYFSANKIVHEDEKYSSVDSFDTIVCGDCGNCEDEENSIKEPSIIVRQTPSSTYIYQEILKRIRPSSQNTRPCSRRWYYKVTVVSLFVITCMSCAAFIACIALI